VTWPKIGERVFAIALRGALAEEICVAAEGLLRIPDRLPCAEAAAVPVNYLTAAYGLIESAVLRAKQILLVLRRGWNRHRCDQDRANARHPRHRGAASEEKRAFALTRGADQVIDYTAND
jgi:NADPH2:quinone reductase